MVQFLQSFVALSSEKGGPPRNDVGLELVEHLLPYHKAKSKAVRFRVCMIIGAMITALGDEIELR